MDLVFVRHLTDIYIHRVCDNLLHLPSFAGRLINGSTILGLKLGFSQKQNSLQIRYEGETSNTSG